ENPDSWDRNALAAELGACCDELASGCADSCIAASVALRLSGYLRRLEPCRNRQDRRARR
ncbi:hypothetical protein, partial [Salidesulfovibrio brasiliensis]|uniref:hypothetical protein n=1 Tax=Salidesulfovibrio brasiliensis TaxID=221711 RepID=UPI000AFD5BF8